MIRGWEFIDALTVCVCGNPFDVDHAMVCHPGGFMFQGHSTICCQQENTEQQLNMALIEPLMLVQIFAKIRRSAVFDPGLSH